MNLRNIPEKLRGETTQKILRWAGFLILAVWTLALLRLLPEALAL